MIFRLLMNAVERKYTHRETQKSLAANGKGLRLYCIFRAFVCYAFFICFVCFLRLFTELSSSVSCTFFICCVRFLRLPRTLSAV